MLRRWAGCGALDLYARENENRAWFGPHDTIASPVSAKDRSEDDAHSTSQTVRSLQPTAPAGAPVSQRVHLGTVKVNSSLMSVGHVLEERRKF